MAQSTIKPSIQFYLPGDIESSGSDVMDWAALITGASKSVSFTAVLPKSLDAVAKNVTVKSLKIVMRGTKGYVDGISSYTEMTTNYSVDCKKMNSNSVRFWISKDTAMSNVDNNTPLVVTGSYTLQFT